MLTGHGVSTRQAATLTGLVARPRLGGATPPRRSHPHLHRAAVEPANKLTDLERRRSWRCSPVTGSSISRRCRSTPNCSTRASTCVRCPRCTEYWQRTRWSRTPPAGAAPAKVCPELVRPRRGRCIRGHHQARGPVKGTYFDAYVMIDIYSRYIVGVHVHATNPVFWQRN